MAHLRGHAVPLWAGEVIGAAPDLGVQLLLVLVPEGRVTHQQDVEDHAWHENIKLIVPDIINPQHNSLSQ